MGQDNGVVGQVAPNTWLPVTKGSLCTFAVLASRAWGQIQEVYYDRNTDCHPEETHDLGGGG
jgi:hypothetical protein